MTKPDATGEPRAVDKRCMQDVWDPPGYWDSHQCWRKAKFRTRLDGRVFYVCTQHAKWFIQSDTHTVEAL